MDRKTARVYVKAGKLPSEMVVERTWRTREAPLEKHRVELQERLEKTIGHGKWHYDDWGNPSDKLSVGNLTAAQSGRHLLQAVAGNGAGDFTTGITSGVKAIEAWDGGSTR